MSTRGLQPPVLSQELWVCLLLIQGSCGRWSHAWWDWDIPTGQEPEAGQRVEGPGGV